MSNKPFFIDLKQSSEAEILELFKSANHFQKEFFFTFEKTAPVALIFFEPSTRTRMSFEIACNRLGLQTVLLSGKEGTSLEKGETFEDTIYNIAAMDPSLLIVRGGAHLSMQTLAERVGRPWINAGWGAQGHPTQALLDAYSIHKFRGRLKNERVLFVGDIKHSRVVSSHFELAQIMNYEVGLCGPAHLMPSTLDSSFQIFSKLEDGLRWATVVMALRVQHERHEQAVSAPSYEFGLSTKSLSHFSQEGLIMHPGPVNWGVELSPEVASDPRCRILQQVTQGVYVRQALVYHLLRGKK